MEQVVIADKVHHAKKKVTIYKERYSYKKIQILGVSVLEECFCSPVINTSSDYLHKAPTPQSISFHKR